MLPNGEALAIEDIPGIMLESDGSDSVTFYNGNGEEESIGLIEPSNLEIPTTPNVEKSVYFSPFSKEDLRGKIVYNREGGTVSRIIRTLDDYEIGVHETLVKPPDFDKVGYSLIFRNNRWEEIEDHRNEMWFDGETPVEITELGPVPSNLTEEPVRQPTKFNLQSFAVEQREAKQAEGVEFYGYNFSSDAESNLNLMASAIRAKADPNYKVNWKTRNGFVQLDSALIIELSNIVTNWIEATFDAEMAVQEKIDSRQIRSFQRVADEYQKEFESIIDNNQPV
jgi:hypothetical protein